MPMKFTRSCRDVTALVLAGEDRRLTLLERTAIRVHYLVCEACPRFGRQVALMREASARWRRYGERDDTPR